MAAGAPEGCSDGANVGSGFWRQIGISGFGVGVGTGVGRGLGVGGSVGSGFGGTRGSGKRGSPAAESACERFQSGPYAWGDEFGDGDTATGTTDCSCCSVACPMTRLPIRSPIATAASNTTAPMARTIVLYPGERPNDVELRGLGAPVAGLPDQMHFAQIPGRHIYASRMAAELDEHVARVVQVVA
jgi:hypothetical protein